MNLLPVTEPSKPLIEQHDFDVKTIDFNVCYKNKYTKRSSNTLLRLVYLFSDGRHLNRSGRITCPPPH